MKIIVDSNRVIAALIKQSTTREILFNEYFELFAPEKMKEEVEKYREEIIEKADSSSGAFGILLSLVFEHISILPMSNYQELIGNMRLLTKDAKDVPYFAACSFLKAEGIWTHDPHFTEQKKFRIFTNIHMLQMSGKDN